MVWLSPKFLSDRVAARRSSLFLKAKFLTQDALAAELKDGL